MRTLRLPLVLLAAFACCGAAPPAPWVLGVRSIAVAGRPTHLSAHRGTLLVSCFHADALHAIDTDARRAARVRLRAPGAAAVAGGKVFAGETFGPVVVFDLRTRKELKRLPLAGDGCFAASADGKAVYYATNGRAEFHAIDGEARRIRTVRYPGGGHGIGGLALSPDGKRLYLGIQRRAGAAGGNSFLAAYDLVKGAYAGTVDLYLKDQRGVSDDGIPAGLAFAPDGRRLYVGMRQSLAAVWAVDATPLARRSGAYLRPGAGGWAWADVLGVAAYRGWVLAATRDDGVAVLDAAGGSAVARLTLAGGQAVSAVAVDGERIYVAGPDAVHEVDGRGLTRLLRRVPRDPGREGPVEIRLKPG